MEILEFDSSAKFHVNCCLVSKGELNQRMDKNKYKYAVAVECGIKMVRKILVMALWPASFHAPFL